MLKQRATPGILQPDVLGDGRGNQPWLPDRRQRNEIHAVGKIAGHLRSQPDAKARLAAAARAGQREEAVVAQEPSASSCSLPMKLVSGRGRLFGVPSRVLRGRGGT